MVKNKYKLLALIVKSMTGVLGTSLILQQEQPYIILIVLAIGAGANEVVMYFENNKNEEGKK